MPLGSKNFGGSSKKSSYGGQKPNEDFKLGNVLP
jgi:hypothetical protein